MPYILLAIFVLIVIWGIYIYFENNRIDVSRYEVNVKDLPESFENYKIVQISDFHNNMLGSENCKLTDAVEKEFMLFVQDLSSLNGKEKKFSLSALMILPFMLMKAYLKETSISKAIR